MQDAVVELGARKRQVDEKPSLEQVPTLLQLATETVEQIGTTVGEATRSLVESSVGIT